MTPLLLFEQALNGIQLGVMLFLMSAGLTLVFGIMSFINLSHGSFYMLGAFFAATFVERTGSFAVGVGLGLVSVLAAALAVESLVFRHLYRRDHLAQVLGTFGLLLFFNEVVRMIWGSAPKYIPVPALFAGAVEIVPGSPYPTYRLVITAAGLAVGIGLYHLITRTRTGMLIRAGASNPEMVQGLGIDVRRLAMLVLGLGSVLAGLAGIMVGPLLSVEVGMGEPILILAFVVVVIGGMGSVRGAFVGALLVGLVDTFGRFLLPRYLGYTAGPAVSSMSIYLLMAAMLFWRPRGLFPAAGVGVAPPPDAAPVGGRGRLGAGLHVPAGLLLAVATVAVLAVPLLGEPFYTRLATRVLIFALAAMSLDLIFGYGGMVSFGHAAFLGIGAYTVGILSVHGVTSAFVAWPAAAGFAGAAALAIGAVSLRTSGVSFIMITLAFAQMLFFFAVSLADYGGDDGMSLPERSRMGGILDISDPGAFYYLTAAVLAVALFAGRRLVRSRFGMVVRGAKENENRMLAVGFPVFRYKLVAFGIAGALCGLAGAMLANVDDYVGPSSLHWFVSGELMIMVILGGAGTLFGPVIGAAAYLLLEEVLSGVTEHWMAVFGPLLVLVVIFARGGIYGWLGGGRDRG